jgi:UDPglucose 6-dehydrogenase
MRIAMVGTGYVGLVSGACFADFGINVTCVDNDAGKVERMIAGEMPIYEAGLEELVERQTAAGRLRFTTDLASAVKDADAVFIAVGTPAREEDGHADLSYVYQAARDIAKAAQGYTVLVTKSTVPVGTARELEKIVKEANPNVQIDVCSNPEFLREGSAIIDFMKPDRVVIGSRSEKATQVLRALYRPMDLKEIPLIVTTPETSEIIKYAANAFLATKITFINEIANLCEVANGDVQDVAKAIGIDTRIGAKFLNAGPGYGGSCFPKDTLALTQTGRQFGVPQRIVEGVVMVNTDRQQQMAQKIIAACGGDVKGKKIGVLGIAFKPNTNDVRDAPSLVIIPILQAAGAIIAAHDPIAMPEGKELLSNIDWKDDAYSVAQDADALVIITEWDEYRGLDLKKIAESMKEKRLIDLRNIYKMDIIRECDFHYVSVGRPDIQPATAKKLKAI